MNARELALLLAQFRATGDHTDPTAAAALGIPVQTFCAWKNKRCLPDALTLATMERRLRGANVEPVTLTAAEFSTRLREWRAQHQFSRARRR